MQQENTLFSNVSIYKRKNCAIFICPYRETAVATIPAIGFEKWVQIKDFHSSIVTKTDNLRMTQSITVRKKKKKKTLADWAKKQDVEAIFVKPK